MTSALETDTDDNVDRRRTCRKKRFSSKSEMEQTPPKKMRKIVPNNKTARSLLPMPIPPMPTEGPGLTSVLKWHVVL